MIERELHIGQQSRTLKCTFKALSAFKTWMPGNIGMREALLFHRDPVTIGIALASLLRHTGKGGDEKMTPGKVGGWMDAELARMPEFEAVVVSVCEEYFRAAKIIEEDPQPGEVKPAPAVSPAPSSSSGTPSSSSPAATESTPASSQS